MQKDSKCQVQKILKVAWSDLIAPCKSTVPENDEVSFTVVKDFGTRIHYKHYTNYN